MVMALLIMALVAGGLLFLIVLLGAMIYAVASGGANRL